MSYRIISKLVKFMQIGLDVEIDSIIIKNIEIKDDCEYTITLQINDTLYKIWHLEELNMIQGVYYSMGPDYKMLVFDKEKEKYKQFKFANHNFTRSKIEKLFNKKSCIDCNY